MQDMNKGGRVGWVLLAGTWAALGLRQTASGHGLKKKKKKKKLGVFGPEYPIGMIVKKKHVKSGRIWTVTF